MKLRTYLVKRTIHMMITLLIVLVLLFVLYRMMPGSAAASMMMQPGMTQAQIDQMMVRYGFGRWAEYPGDYVSANFQPNQVGRYSITVNAVTEDGQTDSYSSTFDVNTPPTIDLSPPVIREIDFENPPLLGQKAVPFVEIYDESSLRDVTATLIYPNYTLDVDIMVNFQRDFDMHNDPARSDEANGLFYFNGTSPTPLVREFMAGGSSNYTMIIEATDQARNTASASLTFQALTGTVTGKVWNLNPNIPFTTYFDYPMVGESISLSANVIGAGSPAFSLSPAYEGAPTVITSQFTGPDTNDMYTGTFVSQESGLLTFNVELGSISAETSFAINSNVATKPAPGQDDDSAPPVLSDLDVVFVNKDGVEIPDTAYPFLLTGDLKLKFNATALEADGDLCPTTSITVVKPDGTSQEFLMKHPRYVAIRSMGEQFVIYMKTMLVFDFGTSYIYQRPAWDVILERVPSTALLFGSALVLAYAIGIMIGVIVAWRRGSAMELGTIVVTLFFYSMPIFWFALIMQWIFYAQLGWFPLAGNGGVDAQGDPLHGLAWFLDVLWHLTLPLVTLTILGLAGDILLMRSSMLEVIGEDFVTTAKAKGLKERTVIYKHAARNAMLPVVTAMAMAVGHIISGGVLTETIFSWFGMGTLLIEATLTHDFPVVQGAFYVLALLTILGNMGADILYAVLDPRVQL